MAEVFVGIVFGGISHLSGFAVDLYECVLCPAPGGLAVVGEYEVPVVVFVNAVAEVVGYEEEGVFSCFPVHAAITAFAL